MSRAEGREGESIAEPLVASGSYFEGGYPLFGEKGRFLTELANFVRGGTYRMNIPRSLSGEDFAIKLFGGYLNDLYSSSVLYPDTVKDGFNTIAVPRVASPRVKIRVPKEIKIEGRSARPNKDLVKQSVDKALLAVERYTQLEGLLNVAKEKGKAFDPQGERWLNQGEIEGLKQSCLDSLGSSSFSFVVGLKGGEVIHRYNKEEKLGSSGGVNILSDEREGGVHTALVSPHWLEERQKIVSSLKIASGVLLATEVVAACSAPLAPIEAGKTPESTNIITKMSFYEADAYLAANLGKGKTIDFGKGVKAQFLGDILLYTQKENPASIYTLFSENRDQKEQWGFGDGMVLVSQNGVPTEVRVNVGILVRYDGEKHGVTGAYLLVKDQEMSNDKKVGFNLLELKNGTASDSSLRLVYEADKLYVLNLKTGEKTNLSETGKSEDKNLLDKLTDFLSSPKVALAQDLEPTAVPTPTPEPTPTPDPAKERLSKILSQESIWLEAGVPAETWAKWKESAEKGEITADFETFVAQASIVERLLSEGKIQSSTSLEWIDPAKLSFKVEFVKSENTEMPVVFAVDSEGGAYIASLNKPINQAGFPKLDYKEEDYSNLFKVPDLVGLTYELVNFNQVMYKGFIKEKSGNIIKMPDLLMTPQDLYSGEGFEKFYWNGLYRQGEFEYDLSFNGLISYEGMELRKDVYGRMKVSATRPSVAIYTVSGFEPRSAQKIIGLEYAKEGEEKLLVRTVRLVGKINELLEDERLKELRPYFVKVNDKDPVFTTFWLPSYTAMEKRKYVGYLTTYGFPWKKVTNTFHVFIRGDLSGRMSDRDIAVNLLAEGPMNELYANGRLYIQDGYGAFEYVNKSETLEDLINKAKVINNNDTSDGEIGYMHFVSWIFERLGM